MLRWHGHLLPLWKLVELFESPRDKHDESRELVVILEDDGKHVAVQIDDLLGQQQVVIKSLGASFKDIKGISGGAILPDGLIGLIVDVAGLVRLAQTTHISGDPPQLE
jgi:two-component system chemotaxis sensor kinase CheA